MTKLENRKALLISPELCIGCRSCQTACKAWNGLSSIATKNTGAFQNPPDLSATAYNIIQFREVLSTTNTVRWFFVSRRCMHCGDAGCMKSCPVPGALTRTKEGAVTYDKDKCVGCRLCLTGCPFDVPRYDSNNKLSKCNLCADRIAGRLSPACAKTCPTGAIRYGDRDSLISAAKKSGCLKVFGETDLSGLGVLFAFRDEPEICSMPEKPAIPEGVIFWNDVLKPMISPGGSIAGVMFRRILIGPHKDEEDKMSLLSGGRSHEDNP